MARRRDEDGTDLANMLLEAGNAVATEHEPDFERAEAAAETQVPVAVLYSGACDARTT